jgi:hypothetical protein
LSAPGTHPFRDLAAKEVRAKQSPSDCAGIDVCIICVGGYGIGRPSSRGCPGLYSRCLDPATPHAGITRKEVLVFGPDGRINQQSRRYDGPIVGIARGDPRAGALLEFLVETAFHNIDAELQKLVEVGFALHRVESPAQRDRWDIPQCFLDTHFWRVEADELLIGTEKVAGPPPEDSTQKDIGFEDQPLKRAHFLGDAAGLHHLFHPRAGLAQSLQLRLAALAPRR